MVAARQKSRHRNRQTIIDSKMITQAVPKISRQLGWVPAAVRQA
jgi:hypothetical protein